MTAEQLHDALGLLPPDLIREADAWRSRPQRKPVTWQRWAALAACLMLLLGCGFFALHPGTDSSMDKLTLQKESAAEAPAAMAPPQEPDAPVPEDAAGDIADNSLSREEAEEAPAMDVPPVDTENAFFCFGELSVSDEVHLLQSAAALEALGLGLEQTYDAGWFDQQDLLLIALPGVTSKEGLQFSVKPDSDTLHWEIHIDGLTQERADCTDSLLICIPVQKDHISANAAFTLIPHK